MDASVENLHVDMEAYRVNTNTNEIIITCMIPVILFPLSPASPKHKNPQRRTKVHGMRPVRRKDWSEDVFVEYPVRVISVAVV